MNKNIFLTLLTLSAAILPVNLKAQSSFENIVDRITSNNPDLKSANLQLEAEMLQEKASINLSDPEIEFSHKWGQGNAAPKTEFGITQSFDWPGVYRYRNESVRHKLTASQKLLKANIADRRLDIKLALIDLVYQNRLIGLLTRRVATIDTLLVKYSRPENATDLTRLDINKLKIERYRLNSKLTDARIQKNNMLQLLTAMNGNNDCSDASNITDFPEEKILDAAAYDAIFADSPTILATEAQSKALTSQIKAEKAMRLPGLSVGYRYAREENTSFNGFSVGLTLPFFSTRNKVASASMLQQALELENLQMRNENTTKTYAMLLEVQTLKNEVSAAEKLLAETDYNRLLGLALNGGQISLTEYLIENNYYLQFEEDYLDARYRYQCAAARLNKYVTK